MPKYYNLDQVRRILSDELRQGSLEAYFLVLFLWNTGVRISEALSVRVGDIDLNNGILYVKTLKRDNHVRAVPLKPAMVAEYALWLRKKGIGLDTDLVFPFSRKTAYNYVRKACKLAGLDIVGADDKSMAHPHTFRHSFAVHCLTHGTPITVVQEWLGHRDLGNTLIYTKFAGTDSRMFMNQIDFS